MIGAWIVTPSSCSWIEVLSLESIGGRFGLHPSTVGYWVRKHGLVGGPAQRHAAAEASSAGSSTALVRTGDRTGRSRPHPGLSATTVRHWARKFALETRRAVAAEQSRTGKRRVARSVQRICHQHGRHGLLRSSPGHLPLHALSLGGRWPRGRTKVRETIVQEAGGRCAICGYDRCTAALQFPPPRSRHEGLHDRLGQHMVLAANARRGPKVRSVVQQLPRRGGDGDDDGPR